MRGGISVIGRGECNEIDIVIARTKVRVLRCIAVVFECMPAQVLRLRDGYVVSTECAMYS